MRSLVGCVIWLSLCLVPAAPAAAGQPEPGYVGRVLELTNAARLEAGLPPLAISDELENAAQSYSQVLASSGCFGHTCGAVPNFIDRDALSGYTGWVALGENVAAGYATPESVVAGWLASPAHRANILSPDFSEIGIGMATPQTRSGPYWAEEFGSRPQPAD
jgi:uncharacterized protein YkwD